MAISEEEDILQPLRPEAKDDQNLWPEFTLKNVKVTSATGELVSLLSAHGKEPLRVDGQLDTVDRDYAHLVKQPKYRKRPICLRDVTTYSFSQYDDGSLGFWAAGKAGWYEMKTVAAVYKEVHKGMNEATGMFYYLADKYRSSRSTLSKEKSKGRDEHVRRVMSDYLNSDDCQREDADDAREGFYEHHHFLIKSMVEGQEDLDWEHSPILKHLKKLFPADFRSIAGIVLGKSGAAEEDQEDMKSEEQPAPKQSKRKGKGAKKASIATSNDASLNYAEEEVEDEGEVVTPPPTRKRKSQMRPKSEKSAKRFSRYDRSGKSIYRDQEDTRMRDDDEETSSDSVDAVSGAMKTSGTTKTTSKSQLLPLFAEKSSPRTPLPSYYEPRGPGDTWTCPYDGCNHKIWDARSTKSVELIKSHFQKTHVDTMEDVINSESRPWVSVSHLLERVKRITGAKTASSMQQELPERVIRRY